MISQLLLIIFLREKLVDNQVPAGMSVANPVLSKVPGKTPTLSIDAMNTDVNKKLDLMTPEEKVLLKDR